MGRRLRLSLLVMMCCVKAMAIEAVVSHAVFYVPDNNNGYSAYAEVYWQIAPNSLLYMEPELHKLLAKVKTEITFSNDKGVIKQDKYIMQTNPVGTQQEAFRQNIIELQRYTLPEGKITMQVKLTEVIDSNSQFSFIDTFTVSYPTDKPKYSDLQLLDTAYASQQQTIFSKNNMQQVPLCANFLDDGRNNLFFYGELYESRKINVADTDVVIHRAYISRKPMQEVAAKLTVTDTIKGAVIYPLSGKFNISKLPSGNYYLNMLVANKQEVLVSKSIFFQRVHTLKEEDDIANDSNIGKQTFEKVNILDIASTFVGKFSMAQLKAVCKMIRPIGTPLEVTTIDNFLSKPDEGYMRYFIYNFWKSRDDKDPKRAWDIYVGRIREVNKLFRGGGIPGYETERGEIYLKYGPPDERVAVENEAGARPYEVWTYNKLPKQSQGVALLFYRPAQMVGDYELLHSNVRGERRNTQWRSYLYIATGSGSGNINSRAEQYFPGNK